MRWRRASNEPGSAPLRRDRRSGHHRKGDDRVRAEQVRVQGRPGRDQAADQGRHRTSVRCQGRGCEYACPQGQEEGLQRNARRAFRHQERGGHAGRGPENRRHHRALSGRKETGRWRLKHSSRSRRAFASS